MVGFGSSLRLARRPGWEGAYLDYETLKLLLSQIEAVYEEENHSRMSRENSLQVWDLDYLEHQISHGNKLKTRSKRSNKHKQRGKDVRDYKDELFLESNSEAAYLSDVEDDFTTADEGEEKKFDKLQPAQNPAVISSKPFAFAHSVEYSLDEERDDDQDVSNGCIPSFGGNVMYRKGSDAAGGTGGGKKKSKNTRKKGSMIPMKRTEVIEEDSFYNVAASKSNIFYMSGGDQEGDQLLTPTRANRPSNSMDCIGSLQYFTNSANANESTSLLPPSSAKTSSPSLFTFFTQNNEGGETSLSSPPFHGQSSWNNATSDFHNQATASGESSPNHTYYYSSSHQPQPHHLQQPALQVLHTQSSQPLSGAKSQQQQLPPVSMDVRRKRERLLRQQERRNQRAKQLRRVPRHLRMAHSKARAITERFLGLLRAETEKVLLFAQSRLGELADTAGSLRFPSFDEEYASNNVRNGTARPGTSFEFGDGGLHPSASSSSDDGGGFGGGVRWSDSSDDGSAVENRTSTTSSKRRTGGGIVVSGRATVMNSLPNTMSGDRLSEDSALTKSELDDALQSRTARSRHMDSIQVVRRQIAHFEALRKSKAVFSRNDQILGEDMLFLSAVEEVDGYTAVGVELIHVLKYICVNLIAVRKICRKHDRLLMNRMLGGFYQRIRSSANAESQTSFSRKIDGVKTLGGLVAQVSGDIYEAHPVLIAQMSHFKLVGLYDVKIQKLSNSRTVQVISSCLALSLSEYEVARSRADALTRLNSTASAGNSREGGSFGYGSEDDLSADNLPSTASSISLTRLRFTVMSIFAFREASRMKQDPFVTYIARSTLSFSGQQVVGEGLDGCSRETLDFLVSYNPDTALLLDSAVLFAGLKQSQWSRLPISSVMISVLATATLPESVAYDVVTPFLAHEVKTVANAVSIIPERKSIYWKGLTAGQLPRIPGRTSISIEGLPTCVLDLSRVSLFLYLMNYFVGHSTTYTFVRAIEAQTAQCATITGVPNVSAALVALIHCWVASEESTASSRCRFRTKTIRNLMIFSTLSGIAGNVIHATAITRRSVPLAIAGRFIFGWSSLELVHRDIVAACLPAYVVSESSRLMLTRIGAIACGLIVGSATEAVPIALQRLGVRTLQASNWLMTLLWAVHLVRVLVQVRPKPEMRNVAESSSDVTDQEFECPRLSNNESDSETSSSEVHETPSSMFYRKSDGTPTGPLAAFGSGDRPSVDMENLSLKESKSFSNEKAESKHTRPFRQRMTFGRFWKLFSFHVGIPVSLLVVFFSTFGVETFFTATPLITHRYFGWSGARAGTFLGALAITTLPVQYICAIVARRYEERTVLKKANRIVACGLLVMTNFGSIASLVTHAPELFADTQGRPSHPYDGRLGVVQYTLGLTVVSLGLIALDGASFSLLSKASPANIRSIYGQSSTVATFLTLFARVLADTQILVFDLSHKLINTDIVNSLIMPLLVVCVVLAYVVNKHFFFLM